LFSNCNPGPIKGMARVIGERNNISYLKITVVKDIKKTGLLKYCITYNLPYILLKYIL